MKHIVIHMLMLNVILLIISIPSPVNAASIPADTDFLSTGKISHTAENGDQVVMDSDDFRLFAAEQRAVQRDLEHAATKMEELATIRTEINTLKTDLVTGTDLSTVAGRLKDLEQRMGDASSGIQDSLNSINSRCDGLDIRMSGLEAIAGSTSYTIAYDYDGGTASNPDCYTGSTDSFTLNNPTKTGYRFTGWTGTLVSSQVMTVSVPQGTIGDLSFTAHWEPMTYYVKYDANGGSGAPSETLEVSYGEEVVITSTTPFRANYAFQGWSKSSSATTAIYIAGNSYKNLSNADGSTVALYAVWKAATTTIVYDANGGSGAPSNGTATYGKTYAVSSTVPIRENYKFLGWAENSSATSASWTKGAYVAASTVNNWVTAGSTKALYAVWEWGVTLTFSDSPNNITKVEVIRDNAVVQTITSPENEPISGTLYIEKNDKIRFTHDSIGSWSYENESRDTINLGYADACCVYASYVNTNAAVIDIYGADSSGHLWDTLRLYDGERYGTGSTGWALWFNNGGGPEIDTSIEPASLCFRGTQGETHTDCYVTSIEVIRAGRVIRTMHKEYVDKDFSVLGTAFMDKFRLKPGDRIRFNSNDSSTKWAYWEETGSEHNLHEIGIGKSCYITVPTDATGNAQLDFGNYYTGSSSQKGVGFEYYSGYWTTSGWVLNKHCYPVIGD